MRAVRESDMVFRFGGDEFVLFCLHNKKNGIKPILARIEKTVAKISLVENFSPTITIGHISCDAKNLPAQAYNDLLKKADEVLYAQKHKRKSPKFMVNR